MVARNERAGALVWMVAILGAVAMLMAVVPLDGRRAAGGGRAQAVADLAALAAVSGGATAARQVAEANGAEVLSCRCGGPSVTVVVMVGGRRGQAAATCASCQAASP